MPLITSGVLVDTSDLFASKGWTTFLPDFTGSAAPLPSLGSTASATRLQKGAYIQLGNICVYNYILQSGTDSTGGAGSSIRSALPVAADTDQFANYELVGGSAIFISTSGDQWTGTAVVSSTGAMEWYNTNAIGQRVDSARPASGWWSTGASIRGRLWYMTT